LRYGSEERARGQTPSQRRSTIDFTGKRKSKIQDKTQELTSINTEFKIRLIRTGVNNNNHSNGKLFSYYKARRKKEGLKYFGQT